GDHRLDRGAATPEQPGQIGGDDLVPGFRPDLQAVAVTGDAGVVDEDIEPSKRRRRPPDEVLRSFFSGNIRRQERRLDPEGLQLVRGALAFFGRTGGNGDPCSGLAERLGAGKADAATAARHKGGAAIQFETFSVHGPLPASAFSASPKNVV